MSLQIFRYNENAVRIVRIDEKGVPWFVARDLCDVLVIRDVSMAIASLDDDEKGTSIVGTPGGPQEMAVVSEPGLYALINRSRKPEAKAFKRWVNHEVLPQIRRTGRYDIVKPANELDAIETNARAIIQMVGEIRESRRIAVEAMQKAEDNSQKIAAISLEQQALIAREQAALASIPSLPEPTEQPRPRTTRNYINEVVRSAAIRTHKNYDDLFAKAYREFRDRNKIDIMQRVRNAKRLPGNSRITGLHVVEELGLLDQFYALCVKLFGLPPDPVPEVDTSGV